MKNLKLKAQRGFTLVEVIVVAVIVAILAGVSIPLYLGYINGSRDNAAANAAGSAASFGAACINGGKEFSLLTEHPVRGNGSTALTCKDGDSTIAQLVVPTDIKLDLSSTGNGVVGSHLKDSLVVSQPFTFMTAVASDK
jgi:prepilin-type N-terminal cleavage/methylation domain-containing protein